MKDQMLVGMDLGQSSDFTALSFIQQKVIDGPPSPKEINRWTYNPGYEPKPTQRLHYYVRHLFRFHRGMPYPLMLDRTEQMLRKIGEYKLVVDATGAGAPVFDMLKERDLNPEGITIHGGNEVTREGGKYRVPKRDLASTLKVLSQTGRIHVRKELKEAEAVEQELRTFTLKIDAETGHDSYEHFKDSQHDDLVISIAMACWYGERKGKALLYWSSVDLSGIRF